MNETYVCFVSHLRRVMSMATHTNISYHVRVVIYAFHSHVCVPFPKSLDGFTYMLNIVDGYSNKLAVGKGTLSE